MKLIAPFISMLIIVIISALFILPLEVYILKDIAQLYNVELITKLSKETIFGLLLIIGILKMSIKDKDLFNKEEKEEDTYGLINLGKSVIKAMVVVFVLLFSWWIAYFIHGVNNL